MPSPDSIALAARAAEEKMEWLLVGGNAVNLLAYSRTTFDVDLLVPGLGVERWISFLGQHGTRFFSAPPISSDSGLRLIQDVKHLIKTAGIDVSSRETRKA